MFLQGFQRPKRLEWDAAALTPNFGEFHAQPFERGFAVTIGNAMRRVLLSSIEGAAITAVRIDGAAHEFTSIPGVREDTTDIILNLKQVSLKMLTGDSQTLTLKAKGPGTVTAADIETSPHVEVLDPERYIATLSSGAELNIEMVVRLGRGYVPAEMNFDETFPIGYIPLDSAHSPVRKVSYHVEGARVGQATDYEKLTLKVWTNRAVTPQDAIARAGILLKDHVGLFIHLEEETVASEVPYETEGAESSIPMATSDKLSRPIEELEISSSRARKALEVLKVRNIGELIRHSEEELLSIENFGKKSLDEIKERLQDYGLSLGTK